MDELKAWIGPKGQVVQVEDHWASAPGLLRRLKLRAKQDVAQLRAMQAGWAQLWIEGNYFVVRVAAKITSAQRRVLQQYYDDHAVDVEFEAIRPGTPGEPWALVKNIDPARMQIIAGNLY